MKLDIHDIKTTEVLNWKGVHLFHFQGSACSQKLRIFLNYKNIFKFIYEKGFSGILGMEHGNSIPGKNGEKQLINSYKIVDNFLN